MTISTQVFNSSYTGNGSQKVFNINFPFDDTPSRIQVFLNDVLQASGYTVNNAGPNWNVTFLVAPANGTDIAIVRNTPITQDMIYVPNDEFPAASHEEALDKLTMILQEVNGRAATGGGSGGGGLTDGSYGDITISGGGTVVTINGNVVDFGKMQDIGPGFIGRVSGTGDPTLLNSAQATSLLNTFTPALAGLVPASGGGGLFLRADGTWAAPSVTPAWGTITGSLSDQTDLQTALNNKSNTGHLHVSTDISDSTGAGRAMLTAASAAAQTALLSVFGTGTKGLVPPSPGGTTQYLRADGSWFTPSVSGGATLADGDYGDVVVSGSGTVMTIDTDVVTNAKLANMAANTVKGSVAGGDPIDLSQAQLTALINTFSSGLSGAVPASGGGSSNFLRADGSWVAPTASAAWGSITGLLSNQTDLDTALAGKQPLDADLTTIAGLTATTNNIIQSVGSAWASRTPAQVAATLPPTSGQIYLLRNVGGTASAITADTGNSLTALAQHQMFRFKPTNNSTGATTIAIDGLAAVPLRNPTGGALVADDIHTGRYYDAVAIGGPVTEIRLCDF